MTKKHYENLGRVVEAFQNLEWGIALCIGQMLSKDDTAIGRMVTSLLPFGKLCILANSLFAYSYQDEILEKRFEKIIKEGMKLEEQRNQLFHSMWLRISDFPHTFRMKVTNRLDKGLKHQLEGVRPEDIAAVANDLNKLHEDLFMLLEDMQEAGLLTNPLPK